MLINAYIPVCGAGGRAPSTRDMVESCTCGGGGTSGLAPRRALISSPNCRNMLLIGFSRESERNFDWTCAYLSTLMRFATLSSPPAASAARSAADILELSPNETVHRSCMHAAAHTEPLMSVILPGISFHCPGSSGRKRAKRASPASMSR